MRHIAIEITRNNVWLAVGSTRGSSVQLERLLSKSIESIEDASAALTELVKTAGIRGSKCAAIVRRGEVELRVAPLPTKDLNELPDMVRFSASRFFAMAGENWPIDFIALPSSGAADSEAGQQTTVLAAAMSPNSINNLRRAAHAAGLEVQSILLAPVALSDYVLRSAEFPADDQSSFLLAESYDNGSELTVCKEGKVHFLRSVKTAVQPGEASLKAYANEIKRTAMAASDSEFPVNFERVAVVGLSNEQAAELSDLVAKPTDAIDAAKLFDLSRLAASDKELADKGGWFALASALARSQVKAEPELDGRQIDFLNTRHAIEKKRSLPMIIGSAAAAVLLVGFGIYSYWSSHRELDRQIAELNEQMANNKETLELAQQLLNEKALIDKFETDQVNWLDELAYLSVKSLPANEMVFGPLTCNTQALTGIGSIAANIGVTERSLGPLVERELRDDTHMFEATGWNPTAKQTGNYKYVGNATITIASGSETKWALPATALPESVPEPTENPFAESDAEADAATPSTSEEATPEADSNEDQEQTKPESTITEASESKEVQS